MVKRLTRITNQTGIDRYRVKRFGSTLAAILPCSSALLPQFFTHAAILPLAEQFVRSCRR